jgi:hypothetical protein
MADRYVVICLDSVPGEEDRRMLLDQFTEDRKEIVGITTEQMNHFAGNMFRYFPPITSPAL